jgi:choline dehydrogenase-like flavoprotein
MSDYDYDVIVVGSGFGGSVTALRLTEKGYRVGVLESGRRWDAEDFPKTNWNIPKAIWAPRLGLTGPQRISALGKCLVFSGSGVGGGSLIYGNTLYEPLRGRTSPIGSPNSPRTTTRPRACWAWWRIRGSGRRTTCCCRSRVI